jgi:hypothetical protein
MRRDKDMEKCVRWGDGDIEKWRQEETERDKLMCTCIGIDIKSKTPFKI